MAFWTFVFGEVAEEEEGNWEIFVGTLFVAAMEMEQPSDLLGSDEERETHLVFEEEAEVVEIST